MSGFTQSCQNSTKKKSIGERLDTTETLLKRIDRKFDDIFKDGPKINIDFGKIKKYKQKTMRKSEKQNPSKSRYNEKVKNLIQKIIMGRSNSKEGHGKSTSS
jgi:hypothetical protein